MPPESRGAGEHKPWQRGRDRERVSGELEPRKRVEKPVNPTPAVPDERPMPPEPQRPQGPDRPPRPSENPEPFAPGDPERIRIIPEPPERAAEGTPAPAHKTKMPRLRGKK